MDVMDIKKIIFFIAGYYNDSKILKITQCNICFYVICGQKIV